MELDHVAQVVESFVFRFFGTYRTSFFRVTARDPCVFAYFTNLLFLSAFACARSMPAVLVLHIYLRSMLGVCTTVLYCRALRRPHLAQAAKHHVVANIHTGVSLTAFRFRFEKGPEGCLAGSSCP